MKNFVELHKFQINSFKNDVPSMLKLEGNYKEDLPSFLVENSLFLFKKEYLPLGPKEVLKIGDGSSAYYLSESDLNAMNLKEKVILRIIDSVKVKEEKILTFPFNTPTDKLIETAKEEAVLQEGKIYSILVRGLEFVFKK